MKEKLMGIKEALIGPLVHNAPNLLLALLVLLAPVFFIPSKFAAVGVSKSFFFIILVSLACIFALVGVFRRASFSVPKSITFVSGFLFIALVSVSGLMSSSISLSFFGHSLEVYSVLVLASLFVLSWLTFSFSKSRKKIMNSIFLFLSSFIILILFQLVHLIFPQFLSSLFPLGAMSPIGTWYDMAIFFGGAIIIAGSLLALLNPPKKIALPIYAALLVAVLFLVLVQIDIVWIILAVFSVLLFIFSFSFHSVTNSSEDLLLNKSGEIIHIAKNKKNPRRISYGSIILLLISIFFLTPIGSSISSAWASNLNVSNVEIRPSFSSGIELGKESFKDNALFGIGPNHFHKLWNLYKPNDINATEFWSAEFNSGNNFISTLVLEVGIIPSFILLVGIVSFLVLCFRLLKKSRKEIMDRYISFSLVSGSLYFLAMTFFYTTGLVVLVSLFFLIGLLMAFAYHKEIFSEYNFNLNTLPRLSLIIIVFIMFCIVVSIAVIFMTSRVLASSVYFQKGIFEFSVNRDSAESEIYLKKAANSYSNDEYWRELANLNIFKLKNLSSVPEAEITDTKVDEFRGVLEETVNYSEKAINKDPKNYLNWQNLGSVYGSLVPLGVGNSYESAREAYNTAISLNPKNPKLYLDFAAIEFAKRDFNNAKIFTAKALEIKPNYTDAYYSQANIALAEDNTDGASAALLQITKINPNDPEAYYSLGVIAYNTRSWSEAQEYLRKAIRLVPQYSNARYFLGLALDREGRSDEAIVEFEEILKYNPDNQEIKDIVDNLKAGRSPLN
jgi:tetratricopeptide (TPR) repeat protein